ncbi:MAG TPA: F0F1 ATP synthase subunit A [Candidatus Saccharimonadales bacterium]
MINPFNLFAASESGPTIHVAPGEVFQIAGIPITNSILYGWIIAAIVIVFLIAVARRVTVKPRGGVVQFVEAGVEFIRNLVENSFDSKKKARRYVPYFVTIFFFILLSNWLGLLPGVGEAVTSNENPLLRPFTGDLNGTFAIGIITMIVVYAASIRETGGFKKYIRHFFLGSPLNPLYLVIGILEMFTDLTRVFSLSLRLFLNVTIGEIVIAVFTYLGSGLAPVAALPFVMLELFVGALQAYIFTMLAVMYLAISVNNAHAHEEDEGLTQHVVPETMTLQTEKA